MANTVATARALEPEFPLAATRGIAPTLVPPSQPVTAIHPGLALNALPNRARSLRRIKRKRRRFDNPAVRQNFLTIAETAHVPVVALEQTGQASPNTPENQGQTYLLARTAVWAGILVAFFALALMYLYGLMPQAIAEIFKPFSGTQLLIITAVFFASGLAKGFSGVGLGLISVPLVTLMYDPMLAVSLLVVPLIITNFHQGVVRGSVKETLGGYGLLASLILGGMTLTTYLSAGLSPTIIEWAIGLSAIVFVALKAGFQLPVIPDQHDRLAQGVTGCVAGILGGLTGLVVIPVMIYMMMRNVSKERFVAVSGFLLLISGVALLLGHLLNDTMTQSRFLLSALAAGPALAAILIAESKRHLISENLFRKVILLMLFAIGAKSILTLLI